MDCSRCGYSLCQRCRPLAPAEREDSFWGKVSALPRYMLAAAAQDVTEIAAEIEAFVFAPDPDDFLLPRQVEKRASDVWQEASQLLAEFCSRRGGCLTPEPDDLELAEFWSRCVVLYGCSLRPGAVAEALLQQLRRGREEGPCAEEELRRRRLRALALLLYARGQGDVGREISGDVARHGAGQLERLASARDAAVAEKAMEALDALGLLQSDSEDALPPGSARSSSSGGSLELKARKPEKPAFDATPNYGMAQLGA